MKSLLEQNNISSHLMFIYMSSVVCIYIFAKLFIEMYMFICFEGIREDWLSQLSYPHKKSTYILTYLTFDA